MTQKQLEKAIGRIAFGPAYLARIEARKLLHKLMVQGKALDKAIKGWEGRKKKRNSVSRKDTHTPSRSVRAKRKKAAEARRLKEFRAGQWP